MPGTRGPTWAIIAGGGTAGHVLPALAIAQALAARGHPRTSLHFVGSQRGLERRLVPAAGFAVTLLPGRGIARRLTAANLGALAGLAVAVVRAVALVAGRRPAVVVSVGGYAGVPCALAAVLLRVPLVLAESNAVPGAAHRLVARFARASAVAIPGTPLPRAVVTGNPVRPEVAAVADARSPAQRRGAADRLGLPSDRRVVGVFGGSLGARRINDATSGLARMWAERADVALRHVVGERDWARVSAQPSPSSPASPSPSPGLVWARVEYEHQMELVYAAADVVVCRAGATTVAELAAAGLPSVLVPLPGAPGDHQTANARALERIGAAVLLPDAECTPERLASELDALLAAPARLEAMGRAARTLGRPDAADRVADVVERHARRPVVSSTSGDGGDGGDGRDGGLTEWRTQEGAGA